MTTKIIHKAFRSRLEPGNKQTVKLYQMAGCGRIVFNDSLEHLLNILKKRDWYLRQERTF